MAWRPTECFITGELDNTVPNKVTGWMQFAGMNEKVTFDLEGFRSGSMNEALSPEQKI